MASALRKRERFRSFYTDSEKPVNLTFPPGALTIARKEAGAGGAELIVLGIDPGYALMGWGVVESEGSRMRLINYGCVETKAGVPMQTRLRTLQLGVRDLLRIYRPDDVAFEELFFARNVTTALMVGAARGAAIIAAAEYTENLYEYTPMQIKQAVTGYGKADKKQVQQMVRLLLKMDTVPKPDDAADAIACAITHCQTGPAKKQFLMK